jgi:hypothetical protein
MYDPQDPRDPSEFELEKAAPVEGADGPGPSSRTPLAIAAVVMLVVAAVTAYILWPAGRSTEPALVEAPAPALDRPAGPERPLGAAAEPVELPPLAESDLLVRELVRTLSSHPSVTAWLATDNLIRNFTVVVDNIGRGNSPSAHLTALRPAGPFRVIEGEDELVVDPRSFERYNQIAAAVDSINPDGAARLYTTLKPRLDEAYRELGEAEPFDRALERAIVMLLRTPAVDGSMRLEPRGALYRFQNPALERLTPAQKQLARMGPRNVRVIKARLRDIALALGIAPDRLP